MPSRVGVWPSCPAAAIFAASALSLLATCRTGVSVRGMVVMCVSGVASRFAQDAVQMQVTRGDRLRISYLAPQP